MKNQANKATIVFFLLFIILTGGIIAAPLTVNMGVLVNTNTCDKISWSDSSGLARTASVVKINGNTSGYSGGYFSQVTYMDGATPVSCNESNPAGDLSGLGFMVNHQPTGYAGRGWANSKQDGFNGTTTILYQGANHVIYQTEMNEYADNGNQAKGFWKVKWIYMIRTGNDYIVDSIAYDFSSKPFGSFGNDIRSPYCEMNWTGTDPANTLSESIDGVEFCAMDNAATPASWIFKTVGSSPFSGGYTYNTPGRNIPYTRQWKDSPDREVGYVSTFDLTQQAAGGGYLSGPVNIGGTSLTMPQSWAINYQANGFQNWVGDKMTWGLPYGAAGGETATESGTTTKNTFPDWTWRKNWPAYPTMGFTLLIEMGKKTDDKVHSLVAEEADIHTLVDTAFTAAVGTVAALGQSNLYDTNAFTFKPAGYNHIYHAWEVTCSANTANVTLSLGAISLKNQTFIFDNFGGAAVPPVTVNSATQVEGTDMFSSLDTVNKKIYVTFNKSFTSSVNIVLGSMGTPTSTRTNTIFVSPTNTPFVTPTNTPTLGNGGDCINLHIDRSMVPAMVFMKKLTLKVHVGDCTSVLVLVDGISITSIYNPATKICMFTTDGTDVVIYRNGYSGGATNAVTKAVLYNDKKWAYSFTFDDGRPSTNSIVLPLFQTYGFIGGSALNTQNMTATTDGYVMSWASADNLRAHGWSFFDHNASHQAVTCANISTETVPDQNMINARWADYKCTHFVYPYCDVSSYTCIRDSGLFLSAENNTGNNYADVLPTNAFILNRNGFMAAGAASTAAVANSLADDAASDARPRWLINFAHGVTAGSTAPEDTYGTNEATLTAHIAYVYNTYGVGGSNNMWFAPTDEVMQYILTREKSVVNFMGSGPCGAVTPATPTMTQTATVYQTPTNTPLTSDCLLDDMEDNNNANNFGGYWFTTASGTGATVVPASGGTFTMTAGGQGPSSYCAHMNGTVGTITTYPSIAMVTQLNVNATAPLYGGTGQVTDISGCGGVQFWAKGDGKVYYFKIPYTDVNDNSLTGYGDYKAPFTAPASWTLITIPFSSLTQETWDTQVNKTTVLQNAKVFQFVTSFYAASGTTTADLSVDNVKITSCSVCPGASVPTATNTPTKTATPTGTSTATFTGTATKTSTSTSTFTATLTFTNTYSPTQTPYAGTPTDTWTQSETPTITATLTITDTFTSSATATMTSTSTLTQTCTDTMIITDTYTYTVTATPTIVIDTATFTVTVTYTATLTATLTPSVTITNTNSPTITITCTTVYSTFTATPTVTVQVPTPSGTLSIVTLTPVIVYPNPNPIPGSTPGRNIKFTVSRAISKMVFKAYTSMGRLVRMTEKTGSWSQGERFLNIDGSSFQGLAKGVYYYVIIVTDKDTGKEAKSPIEKVLIQ